MRIAVAVATVFAHTASSPVLAQREVPDGSTIAIDDVVARMNEAEKALAVRMRMYHPLVEVYVQHVVPDAQLGWTPVADDYFLGQFDLAETPRFKPLSQPTKTQSGRRQQRHPVSARRLRGKRGTGLAPADVRPLRVHVRAARVPWRDAVLRLRRQGAQAGDGCAGRANRRIHGKDGFTGRIWVEDRDYNLVRFNGINRDIDQTLSRFFRRRLSFHMDGWRVNTMPGVWLPVLRVQRGDRPERPQGAGAAGALQEPGSHLGLRGAESRRAPSR